MSLQSNWQKTLDTLRQDLSTTVYEAWFERLVAVSIDKTHNILHIGTDNPFIMETINNRYMPMLKGAVRYVFEEDYNIILEELRETPQQEPAVADTSATSEEDYKFEEEYYLNPRFSFESFVVGQNNEFAYSAALAVAQAPAKNYNPLFLYGGSGLGKTHLMHAIGHYILKNTTNKKVLYVSSEMFTNELINAIRDGKVGTFKNKYRNIDVLLIDDIQFLEGKERTQEEFFHTFNALYDRNSQIVISSDRPPGKLTNLDDRLTSRFAWNVAADIQPPDYETRVAILMKKAQSEDIEITDEVNEVISLIAGKIKQNVRILEGSFTRIISFSALMNRPINTHLAREVLTDMLSGSEMKITEDTIKKVVANYYGITIKDIDSTKRNRNFAYPRQIAMYLSKEMTDSSLPKIGKAFGGKDHTTVLHAHKKIAKEMAEDDEVKAVIDELKKKINES